MLHAGFNRRNNRMKATLVFEGKWLLSKQNSHKSNGRGGMYKNPKYAAEQYRMRETMTPQLRKQGWVCTDKQVSLKIIFYGPSMPVDWDNGGVLTDAMQGQASIIGHKRYRAPGLVVLDDRQFLPAHVDLVIQKDRKIVVELEEIEHG